MDKSAINGSLPQSGIERYAYEAKHHSEKRKFQNGRIPVTVSVQYDGDELEPEQVELVEALLAWRLYKPVQRFVGED